jgi:hypothetical protein
MNTQRWLLTFALSIEIGDLLGPTLQHVFRISDRYGIKGRSMTLDEFRKSLSEPALPAGLGHALAGLWWDKKIGRVAHPFAWFAKGWEFGGRQKQMEFWRREWDSNSR